MFKSAVRAAPRRILPSRTVVNNSRTRFLSTAPPTQKSRSWKSSAARWALAAGAVYYYNTSSLFAEEPEASIQKLDESIHHIQDSELPTVDAIVEEKRQRYAQRIAEEQQKQAAETMAEGGEEQAEEEGEEEGGMDGLEEEAGQQGAFNPETGEINWDCPCLGGMAHGPCGDEFKEAFSCFVYSDQEPKGVECIEKFKGMQDCFRQHPEMYGAELEDDEEEVEEELRAREASPAPGDEAPQSAPKTSQEPPKEAAAPTPAPPAEEQKKPILDAPEVHVDTAKETVGESQDSGDEGSQLLPKAAHDATK
ncbi:Mitochondrial intermembrane space import and assembly protein 40 [Lachnellula hyalina]|uniref:Mitochondrial intermembrane space import and assembly protein 40 n=1 Tax=Lachnellula hyalina TaxID=1316788 RepID=A0A8H8R486_9HELO|nr:Mitochondrial intermembrane space import and assembly protein 40 [Lachnellula hyalina]TVY26599.1 Mitochondrial intermembrane space import and assembly protein 40 [Lachnellula hyalina]